MLLLFSFLCLPGKLEERLGQVAIARGILVEIVLVVFLGSKEILKRLFLDGKCLRIGSLLFLVYALDDGEVVGSV